MTLDARCLVCGGGLVFYAESGWQHVTRKGKGMVRVIKDHPATPNHSKWEAS